MLDGSLGRSPATSSTQEVEGRSSDAGTTSIRADGRSANHDANRQNGADERSGSRSGSSGATTGSSCRGCLYFSRNLKDAGRNPICVGISRSESIPDGASLHRGESAAEKQRRLLADFKYACIGYSLCRETNSGASSSESGDTAATLPLCQGVEILADRRVEKKRGAPVSGREQSEGGSQERDHTGPAADMPSRQPGGVPWPLGSLSGLSHDKFVLRFMRSARSISNKCYVNMLRVGKSVRDGISGVFPSDRGRSKG